MLREIFGDPHIAGYLVGWKEMVDRYTPLPSVLASLVGGFVPHRRSHGLSVGWGIIL